MIWLLLFRRLHSTPLFLFFIIIWLFLANRERLWKEEEEEEEFERSVDMTGRHHLSNLQAIYVPASLLRRALLGLYKKGTVARTQGRLLLRLHSIIKKALLSLLFGTILLVMEPRFRRGRATKWIHLLQVLGRRNWWTEIRNTESIHFRPASPVWNDLVLVGSLFFYLSSFVSTSNLIRRRLLLRRRRHFPPLPTRWTVAAYSFRYFPNRIRPVFLHDQPYTSII